MINYQADQHRSLSRTGPRSSWNRWRHQKQFPHLRLLIIVNVIIVIAIIVNVIIVIVIIVIVNIVDYPGDCS